MLMLSALPRARIEFLLLSIVKVQPDSFNKPVLGDRLWGMYDSFPELIPKGLVDAYVLRRDQNRPGGFTGTGRLGINTFVSSSSTANTPIVELPGWPVSFAPMRGSAIVRVNTAWIGVL